MKRTLSVILLIALMLAGCSADAAETPTTLPRQTEDVTLPSAEETLPETPEQTVSTEPEQTEPPETKPEETSPPETVPAETTPEETVPPETKPQTQQKPTQTQTQQKPTTGNSTKPTVSTPTTQKPDNSVLQFKHRQITVPYKEWTSLEFTYTGNEKLYLYTFGSGLTIKDYKLFPQAEGRWEVCITDGVYKDVIEVIVSPVAETLKGDIYFEQSHITLQEGENRLLSVKGDIRGEYVTYTSSNPNIASVSGGFLLAVDPGTVTITATHYHRTTTMTVTVTPDPSIVRINAPDEITVYVRHSVKLDVRYNGDQTLKYDSRDENIAYVTQDGTVYGVSPGVCKIFISDRSRGQYCTVTVLPDPDWKPTSEIKTDNFSAPLYDGIVMEVSDIITFQAWNVPDESYDLIYVDIDHYNCVQVDWRQDMNDIYTIQLQCAEPGTATLTLTSEDGNATLSYTITVIKKQK